MPSLFQIFFLARAFLCGRITFYNRLPISNTISNCLEKATYDFRFVLETDLDPSGLVRIVFPAQFPSDLGLLPGLQPICSPVCSAVNRTVEFRFSQKLSKGVVYSASVRNITNPPSPGGTANFYIQTAVGSRLIDESLFFGVIGVAGPVLPLDAAVVRFQREGVGFAGQLSVYEFELRTKAAVKGPLFIRLYFPKGKFGLAEFSPCRATSFNRVYLLGELQCQRQADAPDFDLVDVQGVEGALGLGETFVLTLVASNPPSEQITDDFGIALIKSATNIIFQKKMDIAGLSISPARIAAVSLQPIDKTLRVTRNKTMWFRLSFQLANFLGPGSVLRLVVPASVKLASATVLDQPVGFLVVSGLEDRSPNERVQLVFDSATNYLLVRGFAPKSNLDPIVLDLLITTPDNPGQSSPIEITSLTSELSGLRVDLDNTWAKMAVDDVTAPLASGVSLSAQTITRAPEAVAQADFSFQPLVTAPANGLLRLVFPAGLFVQWTAASGCLVQTTAMPGSLLPTQCFLVGQVLTIYLIAPFYRLNSYQFRLQNVVYTPQLGGDYYVDATTLLADQATALESFALPLSFGGAKLLSASARFVSREKGEQAFIIISFTLPLDLPAASDGTLDGSVFDIAFVADATFQMAQDLNFQAGPDGALPCSSAGSMTPVFGSEVSCRILPGLTPSIRVLNFQALKKDSQLSLYIPGFTVIDGNVKVKITLVRKIKRQFFELATTTLAVSVAAPPAPTLAFDFSQSGGPSFYFIDNYSLDGDFRLWFDLKLASKISGGQSLVLMLPAYGAGFCPAAGVKCALQGSSFPCVCVPPSSWIFLQLGPLDEISTSDSFVMVEGLRWPGFVKSDMVSVRLRVADATDLTAQSYLYPAFPAASPYGFLSAELVSDAKRDTVDSVYEFEFMLPVALARGDSLTIDFPFVFDLTKSTPAIRVSSPELQQALFVSSAGKEDDLSSLDVFVSANQIAVHDLPDFPANQTIRVTARGVYSPDYEFKVSGFNARLTTKENALIAQQLNFAAFYFQRPDPLAEINFKALAANPLNAGANAQYSFAFDLPLPLSAGALILLAFPQEYIHLPESPECEVAGVLASFKSCYVSLGSLVVELDSDVSPGEALVKMKGVSNPDKGPTGFFGVSTQYDLRTTGRSVQMPFHSLNITKQADAVSVISGSLNPSNEGEVAILTLYLLPTVDVTPQTLILLVFPRKADRALGGSLLCSGVSGLKGPLPCAARDGVLTIAPGLDYAANPDIPLGLELSGLVVPNRSPQLFAEASLEVAFKLQDSAVYLNYNPTALDLDISKAPSWLSLSALSFSSYACRYTANMSLNLTFYSSLPKVSSGGQLFVDLPPGFSIARKKVSIVSRTADFGSNLVGEVANNRLSVSGNLKDFTGELALVVFRLDNPVDPVQTSAFIVRSFDAANNKIIERCYENLDPVFLAFDYPGPLIVVNGDQPIEVNRGTVREQIAVDVEGQAALTLSLRTDFARLMLYPSSVTISLGTARQLFGVSLPQDFPEGTYRFSWQLVGEKIPRIYTPIREQVLRVVTKRPVTVKVAEEYLAAWNSSTVLLDKGEGQTTDNSSSAGPSISLPFGGKSLPIVLELENSPDTELIVRLNLKKNYKGIALTDERIRFSPGQRTGRFQIYFSDQTLAGQEALASGSVDLQLQGVNAEIFALDRASLDFRVAAPIDKPATILSFATGAIAKNSATLLLTADQPCQLLFLVALKGTSAPSFEEVANKTLRAEFQPFFQQFGELTLYKVLAQTPQVLNLSGLLPQLEYVLHAFTVSAGARTAGPFSWSFKTLARDRAADVSLKLGQFFFTFGDKRDILKHVAQLLSLPEAKLAEKKYAISLTDAVQEDGGRRLQESAFAAETALSNAPVSRVSVIFAFNILPSPENPAYPSPRDLGLSLSGKLGLLAARIPNFDPSYTIQSSEFVSYSPRYATEPFVVDFTHDKAVVHVAFDLYGWLFGVAVSKNATISKGQGENKTLASALPTPVQIALGVDAGNVPVAAGSVEISERYVGFNLTIGSLLPETNYTVYLIGANAQPGYPELMDERYLIQRSFKTLKAPPEDFVDLFAGNLAVFLPLILLGFCF